MQAIVFHVVGDIRQEDVADSKIEEPTDALAASEHFDSRDSGWIKVELEAAA